MLLSFLHMCGVRLIFLFSLLFICYYIFSNTIRSRICIQNYDDNSKYVLMLNKCVKLSVIYIKNGEFYKNRPYSLFIKE